MSWWPNYKATFEKNWSGMTAEQVTSQCPTLAATIKQFDQVPVNQISATTLNNNLKDLWDNGFIDPTTGLPSGYSVTDQEMYAFLQTNAKEMQAWLQQIQAAYCSTAPSPSPAGTSNTYWIVGIVVFSLVFLGAILLLVLLQK